MEHDDQHFLLIHNTKYYNTRLIVVNEDNGVKYEFKNPRELYEYIESIKILKERVREMDQEIEDLLEIKR